MSLFEKLFSPIKIGNIELKNRLVFPAITSNHGSESGAITEVAKEFYSERARGGVGLVIAGSFSIEPRARVLPYQFTIYDERNFSGIAELAEIVKRHGARIALQLHHAGSRAAPKVSGTQPVTSFSIPHPIAYERPGFVHILPRQLTVGEIKEVVERYAEGAKRAKELGYDAVEVHCAHSHLIDQFLSPLLNQREDEYGGMLEQRVRFAREVMERVRESVGADYPIICKINASEYTEGGTSLEDAKIVSQVLVEAGASAIQVSVGQSRFVAPTPPSVFAQGCFVPLAAAIKEVVDVPIIAVGRINTPALAEKVLCEGKADMVAMGRPLLADPELPRKAMEGRLGEIRPCIGCIEGCITRILSHLKMTCTVNPAVGREKGFIIEQAKNRKNVFVVGGGPAGMEAALVSRIRGHQVVLCEKGDRLGGQLNLACLAPFKEEFKHLIRFYSNELKRLGVRVRLKEEVTVETIKSENPDVVVLATGSKPFVPKVPGIEQGNVVTAHQVFRGKRKVGDRVVIIGGDRVGCEMAEFLAKRGKKVTILEEKEEIGKDIPPRTKMFLIPRFSEYGIRVLTHVQLDKLQGSKVTVLKMGGREDIHADSIVLALGSAGEVSLIKELELMIPQLDNFFVIGDCGEPRSLLEAIYDGSRVGRMI